MGKLNAIRISNIVEKVHVDFSSLDSLKESTGFKRLYTIHTQKTLDISKELGFHVAEFCDDHGTGGSSLAAKFSGYESLPSDLILCLMDEKYNFLPLSEAQLETLYIYLTTEEVRSYQSQEGIVEDLAEEVMETDYDDDDSGLGYFVEFKVDASWPDSDDDYTYKDTYCLFFMEGEENEDKPLYFKGFITMDGIDRIHETMTVRVDQKNRVDYYELELNKPFSFAFDYVTSSIDSHRKGTATLTLKKIRDIGEKLPGKLKFELVTKQGDKVVDTEVKYLDEVHSNIDEGHVIEMNDAMVYGIAYLDADNHYVILYTFPADKDEEVGTYYVGFALDDELVIEHSNKEKLKRRMTYRLTVKYVEE